MTFMSLIENNWPFLSSRRENGRSESLVLCCCCCFVCFISFVQTIALSSVLFDFRAGATEGLFVVKSDIQANDTTAGMQTDIWPRSLLLYFVFLVFRLRLGVFFE